MLPSAPLPFDAARTALGVEDVVGIVAGFFRKKPAELYSADRHKSVAYARHLALYLCKAHVRISFVELGRAFGGRDNTTVSRAIEKMAAERLSDPLVGSHLAALERALGVLPAVALAAAAPSPVEVARVH